MTLYCYVAAVFDSSMTVIDATTPAAPAYAARLDGAGAPNYLSQIANLIRDGIYVYAVSVGNGYLTIINVTNPLIPTLTSATFISAPANQMQYLFKAGNYCYCCDRKNLYIVDVSNPAAPIVKSTTANTALGLTAGAVLGHPYVSGNYCYLPTLDSGGVVPADNTLTIINISNPAAPTVTGSIAGSGVPNFLKGAIFVFISGSYAYVGASQDFSLTIIDISNPALPTFKGNIAGGGGFSPFLSGNYYLWVEGSYCYCGTLQDGFTIIDISNPAAPSFVSNLPFAHGQSPIFKDGNIVYFGSAPSNTLYLIDVSNPAIPATVGSIGGAGAPNYLGGPYFCATKNYPAPPTSPTITSISPAYGTVDGGTAITITGTGFVDTPTVTIGGRSCTGITFVDATSVTAVTPAGKPGDRDVKITNPDAGYATLTKGFKYLHSKTKCCVASYVLGKIYPNGIMRFR